MILYAISLRDSRHGECLIFFVLDERKNADFPTQPTIKLDKHELYRRLGHEYSM